MVDENSPELPLQKGMMLCDRHFNQIQRILVACQ
ncbi:MAG: hypothetical protein SRB2_02543 [Desulfobacteraceae bacterium Eth-SRB2]|nr:MAG: hypothetical protein SRB2_02543 [Desulfobacteraceae bacterium Eth-SRB2]